MAKGSDIAMRTLVADDHAQLFESFLREQRTALLNFLRRRVSSEADAQDATQESFTRLLRYADSQPAAAWKPLLYRIATNVAHDQARQQATQHGAGLVSLDNDSEELASPELPHDQQIAHEQELALIHGVIMRLPPKCRQVYLLQRLRGMSYTQIAEHCGISRKTVELHMTRALTALREASQRYRGAP